MRDATRRCDGCSAQAWVSVSQENKTIDLCSHHYNKHSTLLHAQGWEIVEDERSVINTKPSVSASV